MKPIKVTLIYMGDSITEGQYVSPALRWTDLISDRITRRYLPTPINIMLANKGVSGETTRQGLERFPRDVQLFSPDIMTLQFGLNDCNCWISDAGLPRVSEAAYRANLEEMIARARCFGARHIILSTNHPTLRHKVLLSGQSLEDRRKIYNDIVRQVAAKTMITLCDIEKYFLRFTEAELETLLLPYPDHLHLSREGHELYAEAIDTFIAEAIAEVVESRSAQELANV